MTRKKITFAITITDYVKGQRIIYRRATSEASARMKVRRDYPNVRIDDVQIRRG